MPPDRSEGEQDWRAIGDDLWAAAELLKPELRPDGSRRSPAPQVLDLIERALSKLDSAPAAPPPDPSVARELRLTASRLRDPGYHWYEHAAVTLEHLAEKLEKGRGDG